MSVPRNFYDDVGGAPVFHKIIGRFYEEVRADPVLRPLYPEEDLGPAEERLRMFLEQYWGGPRTYSDQRGHPRLRMRHMPFKVGPEGVTFRVTARTAPGQQFGVQRALITALTEAFDRAGLPRPLTFPTAAPPPTK